MGGAKGGTQTSTVELPEELEEGARGALAAAMNSAALGYRPNRGITVAAFTPQQQAAMQSQNAMASALGLPTANPMGAMPQTQTVGGIRGYGSGSVFDDAVRKSTSSQDRAARNAILQNYGRVAQNIDPNAPTVPSTASMSPGGRFSPVRGGK